MSPIDDELRAALSGRAQAVTPAADPLVGIERRARQIQRTRIGAAVAGSALAVALVAAVVPAVQSATSAPPREPQFAATPTPSPAVEQARYALDPLDPWTFRGTAVDDGSRATIQGEYATRRQAEKVLLTPLFAQVYEPSQQQEVVFVAQVDDTYRWGVAQYSESGPEFVWDEPLPEPALALAAALPGDEVPRLLVVSAPGTTHDYGSDDDFVTLAPLADGVGTTALDREAASDLYLVNAQDAEIVRAPAPNSVVPEPVDVPEAPVVPQGYGFDPAEPWPMRGVGDPAEMSAVAERLFTARHGSGWRSVALYTADSDAGVSVLFRLHTKSGEPALVSITWRRGDRAPEQTDQVVEQGQALIQASVPTDLDDGTRLLVALASPKAGGIVLTGPGGNRPDGIGDPGVGLWAVDAGEEAMVRLYTEGDGVEYFAVPAATS